LAADVSRFICPACAGQRASRRIGCVSEKERADLMIAISLMNAYNRLAIRFRIPPNAALGAG
jgi:hypothetical protein